MTQGVNGVFRYLSAQYAIQAIEQKCLRVSRLHELNDPFEFLPAFIDTSGIPLPLLESDLQNYLLKFAQKNGLICFSAVHSDPVVWSHYADEHKGIALGFDLGSNENLIEVKYKESRPTISIPDLFQDDEELIRQQLLPIFKELVRTKAPSWGYEEEYRVFCDLPSCQCRKGRGKR